MYTWPTALTPSSKNDMKLKIMKLHPDAKVPTRAHSGDAGLDLYAYGEVRLAPGERKSIPLGIAMEIPEGHAGLIWDKSGLSHKYGLKNFGGVIDAGFRGEIHVGLMNLSDREFVFEKGHKIAQMLIQKVEILDCVEVGHLDDSSRGAKGFGSSGR